MLPLARARVFAVAPADRNYLLASGRAFLCFFLLFASTGPFLIPFLLLCLPFPSFLTHRFPFIYTSLSLSPGASFGMQVKSQGGCLRACTIENEFICRSVLYRPSFKPGQPNCALYHLDHKTFPDGLDTFATPSPIPLLDSGDSSATYFEAGCSSKSLARCSTHLSTYYSASGRTRHAIHHPATN